MLRLRARTHAALLCLAALAALAVWWAIERTAAGRVEAPPAAPAAAERELDRTVREGPAGDAAGERAVDPTAAGRVAVTGRCVAHESGVPLAGCRVRLEAKASLEQATGVDGRFRFASLSGNGGCSLRIEAPDRVTVFASSARLPADLGDLRLPLATRLTVRVVSDKGEPVAGVRVQIGDLLDRPEGSGHILHEGQRVSRDDGTVPLELPRCAGRWQVHVDTPFHDFLGPHLIDIAPATRVLHVDLVVREPDAKTTLSGSLKDEAGAAIAGLELQAHGEQGIGYRTTLTRRDGSFRFPRLWPNRGKIAIRLPREEDRFELVDPGRFPIGTADIALVARRLPVLVQEIQVVDGSTGQPVERYAFKVFSDPWTTYKPDRHLEWRRPAPALHEGGRARAEVRKGKHRLSVWPADERLQPRPFVPFAVGDAGPQPMRIEVFPAAELRVQLRTRNGEPVAGSKVELVHMVGPSSDGFEIGDYSMPKQEFESGPSGTTVMVLLQEAVTDARGEASLPGPVGQEMLAVAARGPGHVPLLQKNVLIPAAGQRVELIVEAGARIRGRIDPVEFREAWGPDEARRDKVSGDPEAMRDLYAAIAVQPVKGRPTDWVCEQRWPIAAAGTFEVEAVPAGAWQVLVDFNAGGGGGRRIARAKVENLVAGEVREIVLDVSDLMPAEIDGIAYVDGVPLKNGQLAFWPAGAAGGGGVRTDGAGRFRARLLPGTALPMAWLETPESAGSRAAYGSETIELQPRQRLSRRMDLYQCRVDLRILESSSEAPASGLSVRFHLPHLPFLDDYLNRAYPRPTDADGRLRLVAVPPGTLEIRTPLPGDATRHVVIGSVQVPAGSGAVKAELRLPAAFRR